MCFLSIFERLHLMRLRATILSVFCLISSPVDCCLFAESPVDWLFIDCDNRMLCQAKRQKSSAHIWRCRSEPAGSSYRTRTGEIGPRASLCCSVVAVSTCTTTGFSLSWPSERGSAYTLSHPARSSPSTNTWMRHLTVNRARRQHVFHRHLSE